ncbi:Holliday junction resolvase RuvX [bacterium]|nr:MAG: Holliday junction resolvase RuvX [bacterium]
MRLLGVDLGTVRIGVAVAETRPFVASPRPALKASGKLKIDAVALAAPAKREEAERIVVGLPLEFTEEGRTEGKMARACRLLGKELEALGHSVGFADEAFTSVAAEEAMRDTGMTIAESRRKKDGEAACRILEAYWEADGKKE